MIEWIFCSFTDRLSPVYIITVSWFSNYVCLKNWEFQNLSLRLASIKSWSLLSWVLNLVVTNPPSLSQSLSLSLSLSNSLTDCKRVYYDTCILSYWADHVHVWKLKLMIDGSLSKRNNYTLVHVKTLVSYGIKI